MSEVVPEVSAEAPVEAPVEATPVVATEPSNVPAPVEAPAPAAPRSFEDEVKAFVAAVESGEKLGARIVDEAIAAVKAHF